MGRPTWPARYWTRIEPKRNYPPARRTILPIGKQSSVLPGAKREPASAQILAVAKACTLREVLIPGACTAVRLFGSLIEFANWFAFTGAPLCFPGPATNRNATDRVFSWRVLAIFFHGLDMVVAF